MTLKSLIKLTYVITTTMKGYKKTSTLSQSGLISVNFQNARFFISGEAILIENIK